MASKFSLTPEEHEVVARKIATIPPSIYLRSHSYVNEEHISNLELVDNVVTAKVRGTELYTTTINVYSGQSSCSCPAAPPCKHVAALARFLTRNAPAPTTRRLDQISPEAQTARLAFFIARDTVFEMGILEENGRLTHLSQRNQVYLKPAHRAFLEDCADSLHNYYTWHYYLFKLLRQPELLEDIAFYIGRESTPRKCTGVMDADFRLIPMEPTNQTKYSEKENYHELRYWAQYMKIDDDAWQRQGDLYLPTDKTLHEFKIAPELLQTYTRQNISLTTAYETPEYRARLSEDLVHEYENAVTIGPRRVLSFYGIKNHQGNLAIECEAAFGYARSQKAFEDDRQELLPIYTILPPNFSWGIISKIFPGAEKIMESETSAVQHKTGAVIFRNIKKESLIIRKHKRGSLPVIGRVKVPRTRYAEYLNKIIPREKLNGSVIRIHESIAGVFSQMGAIFKVGDASGIDWFEGAIEVEGLDSSDIQEILKAYRKKEDILELKNGRWFSIKASGLGELLSSLAGLGLKPTAEGTVEQISYAKLASLEQHFKTELRTENGAKTALKKFKKFVKQPIDRIELPEGFRAVLRPYQQVGVAFIMKLYKALMGGILADDMGLGKTVQAIAAMSIIAAADKKARFLVVCPVAAMGVWQGEIERFSDNLTCYRWHSGGRNLKDALQSKVIITTFGTYSLDMDKFADIKFSLALIDEAQFAKNARTQNAVALRSIQAASILCLTGTPVENRLDDLWALFDLFFPGYLGTLKTFKFYYAGASTYENMEILQRKVAPFLLRRTKAQVLSDLPTKNEIVVKIPMPPEQAKVYEAARRLAVLHMGSLSHGNPLMEMLRHLMNLRRISCHPYLESEAPNPMHSGKLQYLADKLDELQQSASGVLIFSQFTSVLRVAQQLLESRGINPLYLDGQTSEKKRRALVETFQAGKNQFFLISLKAGGTALTLTQADTVIHLDPWWNPAVESQASDRAHRIGQKRKVFVYKFVTEKTVEEKVLMLQEKKRTLFNALLENGSAETGGIGREEISYLLSE